MMQRLRPADYKIISQHNEQAVGIMLKKKGFELWYHREKIRNAKKASSTDTYELTISNIRSRYNLHLNDSTNPQPNRSKIPPEEAAQSICEATTKLILAHEQFSGTHVKPRPKVSDILQPGVFIPLAFASALYGLKAANSIPANKMLLVVGVGLSLGFAFDRLLKSRKYPTNNQDLEDKLSQLDMDGDNLRKSIIKIGIDLGIMPQGYGNVYLET